MDLKCATDMAQTYKDFGFESDILQDRAIYWDSESIFCNFSIKLLILLLLNFNVKLV